MDLSLLLLVTPMTPPTPPPGCPPIGDDRPPEEMPPSELVPGDVLGDMPRPAVVVPGAPCCPRPGAVVPVGWPGVALPGTDWPATSGTNSSFVIGSLNFLRRNRCSTSTSMFGGNALAYLRWNRVIAWTYWLPRKTSSSSLSRWP